MEKGKTKFEKNMKWANEHGKVVYYDYISYKRAAGWWSGSRNDDWNRPKEIEKAKYYGKFLANLPECYFLGLPINELLKLKCSDGYCHSCAIALSLYFKEFEIVTCNLKNYAEHYKIKSENSIYDYSRIDDYEHSFILVNLKDKKVVIDTTFGFITDFDTYKKIFDPNKIRIITSKELENVEPYQYIKSLKNYILNLDCFSRVYNENTKEWETTKEELEFNKIIHDYMDMCSNYTNKENPHLQDFINRCLFRTSNSTSHWNWRGDLKYKFGNSKFDYPKNNMFSLEDDEFDEILYGVCDDTILRNKKVLENYHKENEEECDLLSNNYKNKILKYFKTKRQCKNS